CSRTLSYRRAPSSLTSSGAATGVLPDWHRAGFQSRGRRCILACASPLGIRCLAAESAKMDARNFAVESALRDGTRVTIRAVRSDDRERIAKAFRNLDRESVYTRFFSHKKELNAAELAKIDAMDFVSDVMLVATIRGVDDDI